MKRFTRSVCVILALALLLSAPAYAASEATSWSSTFFASYDTFLYQTSATQFQIWIDVVARRPMDELGACYIEVQRSSDGENWLFIDSYEPEDYPQMICENTGFHADCVTFNGPAGYYYRAYVIIYAKNSTGFGERYLYTETIFL